MSESLCGLVDIIILRFNTPGYDIDCVKSIIENTEYPYCQITLFDNYHYQFNLSKIWNMLIARSYGEYICLLNNDTKPSGGWLNKLMEVFEREEMVGVVGPSTNQCSSPQKAGELGGGYEVIDFEIYGKVQQLSGFCILFPKKIWSLVGGFDERFGFYAQENEFLHRVRNAGYRTLWRKDAFIFHIGEASARKRQEEDTSFNIAVERKKGYDLYRSLMKVR